MKKHTGLITNTGVRCIVVFRKVPNDEKECLVVESDRLPDRYHDSMIEWSNCSEAQDTSDFFEILNRRTFSDGLNALQALHYKGFLRKVPVNSVVLLPFPGQTLPLELLNAQLDGNMDEYKEANKEAKKLIVDPNAVDPAKLLVQAELLEDEAVLKRKEAYELDPSLKPKVTKLIWDDEESKPKDMGSDKPKDMGSDKPKRGRPTLSSEQKAAANDKRKEKRRERDRAKAAQTKIEKKKETLKKKVDSKIVLDAARKS